MFVIRLSYITQRDEELEASVNTSCSQEDVQVLSRAVDSRVFDSKVYSSSSRR